MTFDEARKLLPGQEVLIADCPFDDSTKNMPEYRNVWGTIQIVKRIDHDSVYCVEAESNAAFHYEEIVKVVHRDLDELNVAADFDIKLLFGGDG